MSLCHSLFLSLLPESGRAGRCWLCKVRSGLFSFLELTTSPPFLQGKGRAGADRGESVLTGAVLPPQP
jgi:hypothetical protein